MANAMEFGKLLSKAIRYIGIEEGKNLSIIQDEIGYSLGRKGGSIIEHWRKGNIPPTNEDVEKLAREIVKRCGDSLNREWLEGFLVCADYPDVKELTDELFPINNGPTGREQRPLNDKAMRNEVDSNADTTFSPVTSEASESLRSKVRIAIGILLLLLIVSPIWFFLNHGKRSEIVASTEPTTPASSTTPTSTNTVIPNATVVLCGESTLVEELPGEENLLRHQGVSIFNVQNTPDGILNNKIRSLAVGSRGLLIGYHNEDSFGIGGITYLEFDERKWFWANCITDDKIVNSIAVDRNENIWAATDGGGVLMYNGTDWISFTTENSNLSDNSVYEITIDDEGKVWAASWQGIARLDGEKWTPVYNTEDELTRNPAHNISFDSSNNIWIGHVLHGVSMFDAANGTWIMYQEGEGTIGGNNVRDIVVRKAVGTHPESVWFATDGGGISKYEEGTWTVYGVKDGLPSEEARAIAIDVHGRIWAGTSKGTAFFDGVNWQAYHTLSTLDVTFIPGCDGPQHCSDDHVWTATENGLTHSRLPYPDQVLDVRRICFVLSDGNRECPELVELQYPHIITATYTHPLAPGDGFYFEIEASPRGSYELNEDRDFLMNIDESEGTLFGSHYNVPLHGIVSPGQVFKFSLNDRRMTAPELPNGSEEATFTSSWRTWMFTRFAGPEIRIQFTVKQ